jgi:hypothetical protein
MYGLNLERIILDKILYEVDIIIININTLRQPWYLSTDSVCVKYVGHNIKISPCLNIFVIVGFHNYGSYEMCGCIYGLPPY